MKLILTQDVRNLGHKDDVVSVRPGYGRNFLIPQGMAKLATSSAMKMLAEDVKQRAFKQEKIKKMPMHFLLS
jgi:large subunit ribosomal protein L9